MPHIVTDKCNGCKFTDCVEVCPVTCFYELDNQVVIHPDDCIDCMACVEVCPVHAIYADANVPPELTKDVEFNAVQSRQLKDSGAPSITARKEPLPGAMDRKKALGYCATSLIDKSRNCFGSTCDGDCVIRSRPRLFLGKA